jgi:hypothetical protein
MAASHLLGALLCPLIVALGAGESDALYLVGEWSGEVRVDCTTGRDV